MEEKIWFLRDESILTSDDLHRAEAMTASELALVALLAYWDGATRARLSRWFKPSTLDRTIKALSERQIIIGK